MIDTTRKPMAIPPSAMARVVASNVADMAYRVLFHAVRWIFLVYPARALKTLHVGLWRLLVAWAGWVSDRLGKRAAEVAVDGSAKTRKNLTAGGTALREHDHRVWRRLGASALVFIASASVATLLAVHAPALLVVVGVALLTLVGYVGRDLDQPFLTNPYTGSRTPPITAVLFARVLSSLDITALKTALQDPETKAPSAENLHVEMGRTPNNRGNLFRVELPMGVTAHMVMAKRERFTAGLRRMPDQVYLEAGDRHDILMVTVLDRPASEDPPPAFPMPETVDVFQPIPLGFNPRGALVSARIIFQSLLVGAAPDAGKTSFFRTLGAVLTRDPGVDLAVFELKGTGDLSSLESVAQAYRSGSDPDDLAAVVNYCRWLRVTELPRRKAILKDLATTRPDLVPDFKVTRQLVDDPDVELTVLVVLVDEFHNLSENPETADEWNLLLGKLREMRAAGIIMALATQRPDGEAIVPRWRDMVTYRAALRNLSTDANNMILGSGMAARGFDSTTIGPEEQGTAWLRADDNDPQLVRFGYLDGLEALEVLKATAVERAALGRLSGHALGDTGPAGSAPDTDARRFVDHVLSVWPIEVEWMATADVAARLVEAMPMYDGLAGAEVTRRLNRDHGLTSADKRIDGRPPVKALRRDAVQAAADAEMVTA